MGMKAKCRLSYWRYMLWRNISTPCFRKAGGLWMLMVDIFLLI